VHEGLTKTISDIRQIIDEAIRNVEKVIGQESVLQLMADLLKEPEPDLRYLNVPHTLQKDLKEARLYGKEASLLTEDQCEALRYLDIVLQEQRRNFTDQMTVPRDNFERATLLEELEHNFGVVTLLASDLFMQHEGFTDRMGTAKPVHGPLALQIRSLGRMRGILTTVERSTAHIHDIHERLQPTVAPKRVGERRPAQTIFKEVGFAVDHNLCFVLMPFEEPFNGIYEEIIKPAIEGPKVGMTCKRADDIYGTRAVMEDIWEYINKAAVVVAELTGRNPNVFYELGLSHAVDIPTILITQDASEIPFDLKHLRHIVYEDNAPGHKKLARDLVKTILAVRESISPSNQEDQPTSSAAG